MPHRLHRPRTLLDAPSHDWAPALPQAPCWPPDSTHGFYSTLPLPCTMLYTITALATDRLPALQSPPSLASQPSGAALPSTSVPWGWCASSSLPSTSLPAATCHMIQPPSPHHLPLWPLSSGTEAPHYACPDSSCVAPSTCPCSSCHPLAASPSHSCTGVRPPGSCRSARSLRCPHTSLILGIKNKGHLSDVPRPQAPSPWLPKTHTPCYNKGAHKSTPATCQAHPHVTRVVGVTLGPS